MNPPPLSPLHPSDIANHLRLTRLPLPPPRGYRLCMTPFVTYKIRKINHFNEIAKKHQELISGCRSRKVLEFQLRSKREKVLHGKM